MLSTIQKNSTDILGEPLWKAYCAVPVVINKQGKNETQFLIASKFRLHVVSPRTTGKVTVEGVYNIIFIKGLRFHSDQLELTIQGELGKFIESLLSWADIKALFNDESFSSLLSIEPISLLNERTVVQHPIDYPCGNFRLTYAAVADAIGCPYVDEIAWDIEKIYAFHGWTTLNLNDFSHFTARDLMPLIITMKYSPWFTGIWADSVRLSGSVVTAITKAVGEWRRLRSVRLTHCGLKHDFITALTLALAQNPDLHLDDLDLSFNDFDDYEGCLLVCSIHRKPKIELKKAEYDKSTAPYKTSIHTGLLAYDDSTFEHVNKGQVPQLPNVRALRFKRCGLTYKTLRWIMNLFTGCSSRKSSMRILDVSGNTLKSKLDSKVLYGILPYTPELTELNISFTGVRLAEIWSCLKCCGRNIAVLKIAGCNFHMKKKRQLTCQPSIKDYFASTPVLRHLDISQAVRLSPETLRCVLMGLATNQVISKVVLVMNSIASSGEELLSTLETSLPSLHCVSHLHLRDNEFSSAAPEIISAISEMPNLELLDIGGKNFNVRRGDSTTQPRALQELAKIINNVSSELTELNISEANLGTPTSILLSALVSAPNLKRLNVAGNCIEDAGARLLAKVLMTNCSLEWISLDHNQITLDGFAVIASSLKENSTLTEMELPISDVSKHMKIERERAEALMKEIQVILHRNARKCGTDEAETERLRRIAKWSFIRVENEFAEFLAETEAAMTRCYRFSEKTSEDPVYADLINRCSFLKRLLTNILSACEGGANESPRQDMLRKLALKIRSMINDFYGQLRATFKDQQKNFQLLLDPMEEKVSFLLKKLNNDHGQRPAQCKARAYDVAAELIIVLAEAVLATCHADRQIWVSPPSPSAQKRVPWSRNLQMSKIRADKAVSLIRGIEQQRLNRLTKSDEHDETSELTFYPKSIESLPDATIRKGEQDNSLERKCRDDKPAIARVKPVKRSKRSDSIFKTPKAAGSLIAKTTQVSNWDSSSIYSERAIDCPADQSLCAASKHKNENSACPSSNLDQTVETRFSQSASMVDLTPTVRSHSALPVPLPRSTVKAVQRSTNLPECPERSNTLDRKRLFRSSDDLTRFGASQRNAEASPAPENVFYDAKEN